MAENTNTPPFALNFVAQIATLIALVQQNTNRFLALKDKNVTLRHENCNLSEQPSAVETTPRLDLLFQVPITHMQSLETPELGNASIQPSGGLPVILGFNPQTTPEGQPLITSSAVDTTFMHAMSAGLILG